MASWSRGIPAATVKDAVEQLDKLVDEMGLDANDPTAAQVQAAAEAAQHLLENAELGIGDDEHVAINLYGHTNANSAAQGRDGVRSSVSVSMAFMPAAEAAVIFDRLGPSGAAPQVTLTAEEREAAAAAAEPGIAGDTSPAISAAQQVAVAEQKNSGHPVHAVDRGAQPAAVQALAGSASLAQQGEAADTGSVPPGLPSTGGEVNQSALATARPNAPATGGTLPTSAPSSGTVGQPGQPATTPTSAAPTTPGAPPPTPAPPSTPSAPDATDSARELAAEKGVNLAGVKGTGADGRIIKADVEAHLAQQ